MSKCIGIAREAYTKWERRAPLTPEHVKQLVQRGINVCVQPSTARIFSDEQYERAGATISEDLSSANVVLGVKQVPAERLLPEKTYLFFSHTIKAQPENMALLDAILRERVTLVDYECIRANGKRNSPRLIAFGRNAGRAGMIDGFRGLGERLINLGFSTPFVNIASAYMYQDLEEAKRAVELAGKQLKNDGLPSDLAPMTFVFTGRGNVAQGAQELFDLMPHQMVHPSELPNLPKDRYTLYGTIVEDEYLVQPIDRSRPQSREDYYQNPSLYENVFHERVAPYTSMLVNGMYWDDRFPRLLTKQHIQDLRASGNKKLLGIADITCDINGSVEFLEYTTEIESPFALYKAQEQKMVNTLEGDDGIMMLGVDILPSELAKDSSVQFGDQLMKFIDSLVWLDASKPLQEQRNIPPEIIGACIASDGLLTPPFKYIHLMRAQRERSQSQELMDSKAELAGSTCIRLDGHLFDTGLINQVLNVIEQAGGAFHLADCQVRPNFVDTSSANSSSAVVQISMDSRDEIDAIIEKIRKLAELTPGANTLITEVPDFCGSNYSRTVKKDSESQSVMDNQAQVYSREKRKIVCLGAGLVASPLVEYLTRSGEFDVHVASGIEGEAKTLQKKLNRSNISPHTINVKEEMDKLRSLCSGADCIVSLLPATMHADVAKICIDNRTPLVTASYVSPEMRELNQHAVDAGIPILCELGLDPGMDHMSAMKVIDETKAQNGKILSFSSVCGGLPAPEAADNAIGYKFSWSPRGVLTAALNPAKYLKDGNVIEIPGEELLNNSERVNFLPGFAIEQIPNRNSLPYADIYGISDAHSVFRGTLRYAGCCDILYQLRKLGLFDSSPATSLPTTWPRLLDQVQSQSSVNLQKDADNFMKWLGAYDQSTPVASSPTVLDAFCNLLQEKLAYQEGERDMALMHHEFGIQNADGTLEKRTSTFVGYGSDQGGDTIMAKTVGVTAAIGVQMILQDAIQGKGVLTPTTPDIYVPALAKLEAEGVRFTEKVMPMP